MEKLFVESIEYEVENDSNSLQNFYLDRNYNQHILNKKNL